MGHAESRDVWSLASATRLAERVQQAEEVGRVEDAIAVQIEVAGIQVAQAVALAEGGGRRATDFCVCIPIRACAARCLRHARRSVFHQREPNKVRDAKPRFKAATRELRVEARAFRAVVIAQRRAVEVGVRIEVECGGVQAPWNGIRQDGQDLSVFIGLASVLEDLHLDLA